MVMLTILIVALFVLVAGLIAIHVQDALLCAQNILPRAFIGASYQMHDQDDAAVFFSTRSSAYYMPLPRVYSDDYDADRAFHALERAHENMIGDIQDIAYEQAWDLMVDIGRQYGENKEEIEMLNVQIEQVKKDIKHYSLLMGHLNKGVTQATYRKAHDGYEGPFHMWSEGDDDTDYNYAPRTLLDTLHTELQNLLYERDDLKARYRRLCRTIKEEAMKKNQGGVPAFTMHYTMKNHSEEVLMMLVVACLAAFVTLPEFAENCTLNGKHVNAVNPAFLDLLEVKDDAVELTALLEEMNWMVDDMTGYDYESVVHTTENNKDTDMAKLKKMNASANRGRANGKEYTSRKQSSKDIRKARREMRRMDEQMLNVAVEQDETRKLVLAKMPVIAYDDKAAIAREYQGAWPFAHAITHTPEGKGINNINLFQEESWIM